MNTATSQQIATLPSLTKAQLLPLWTENFQSDPPPKLRKELMVPILAYRIQECAYGGLSHRARSRLRQVADALPPKRFSKQETPSVATAAIDTRLVRVWHGVTHEVTCSEDGFRYQGQHYTSLSKIARVITGTSWSGPAFFGTKKKKAK